MMLERFLATFSIDTLGSDPSSFNEGKHPTVLADLFSRFAGTTFEGGLYRVHTLASAETARDLVIQAFPEFSGRVACFAFDWLGRQFSLDLRDRRTEDPGVLMFEPGSGEALDSSIPFSSLHDQELVEHADEALAREFFHSWTKATSAKLPLPFNECAGYCVPLFLGGADGPSNLELVDIEVYWHILGQLRLGTRHLPKGTKIGQIALEE